MPAYQGRALHREAPQRRRGRLGRIGRFARVGLSLVLLGVLAHLPWGELRHRAVPVGEIRVEGLHYLEAAAVIRRSGLRTGMSWLDADLARARQAVLRDSRIRGARVERALPGSLKITVEERTPVLLVRHGSPWELDSEGVLLAPLKEGVVADVPMLSGVSVEGFAAGTCLATTQVRRALDWARAAGAPELELSGRISEIDVSDTERTGLVLMNGTRVVSAAWPPGIRTLSALRVVLADLEHRGTTAQEVDLRFENQVIVRPAEAATAAGPPPS